MKPTYTFRTEIWQYQGDDPWYFVTVPPEFAEEIRSFTKGLPNKGFGTVKVDATIASLAWETSVFPDKKSGSYLMPVKKDIRTRLQVDAGDTVDVTIILRNI